LGRSALGKAYVRSATIMRFRVNEIGGNRFYPERGKKNGERMEGGEVRQPEMLRGGGGVKKDRRPRDHWEKGAQKQCRERLGVGQ